MDGSRFIGGSEAAKRRARCPKKQKKEIKDQGFLPKSMPCVERFFASLLMLSSHEDFKNSNGDESVRSNILSKTCKSLNLPLPAPLPPVQRTKAEFYNTRAALVMEESRAILCNAILLNSQKKYHATTSLMLHLVSVETLKSGNLKLFFAKSTSNFTSCTYVHNPPPSTTPGDEFSPSELYAMKRGSCFQLKPVGYNGCSKSSSPSLSMNQEVWPVIAPCCLQLSEEGQCANTAVSFMCFQREIFPTIQSMPTGTKFVCRPLTTLISQLRQFEVCLKAPKVEFLPSLLGGSRQHGTHIRFNTDEASCRGSEDGDNCENDDPPHTLEESLEESSKLERFHNNSPFNLPTLNPTQQRVVDEFLSSPSSTLKLVQGPPGTGKSELIVSFLFQSVLQSKNIGEERRIMVCAPTNKAVLAVTKRFHSIWREDPCLHCLLVGVEQELIVANNEEDTVGDSSFIDPSLRGFFLYTWLDCFIEKAQSIYLDLVANGVHSLHRVLNKLNSLLQILRSRIPVQAQSSKSLSAGGSLLQILKSSSIHQDTPDCRTATLHDLNCAFSCFLSRLGVIKSQPAMVELVSTADIIFCTLATSGISLLKHSRKGIHDLVIDEAAAATEVECCIPFFLHPKRLLVVGDPLQLPATIFSQQAKVWGLEKSMHHRLMYECNQPHTMLDLQYRMRPEICLFPSQRFYGGMIANGENVASPSYKGLASILGDRHYSFIHVADGIEQVNHHGSYGNLCEATVVVQLVREFRSNFLKKLKGNNHTTSLSWHSPERVRVITFYSGQVSLIERLLVEANISGVTVATVDSSQGSESDIVIVSFVRSKGIGQRHSVGFLTDNRRLNVALTRARYQLVCVGNIYGSLRFELNGAIKDLLENSVERGHVVEFENRGKDAKLEFSSQDSDDQNFFFEGTIVRKRRRILPDDHKKS